MIAFMPLCRSSSNWTLSHSICSYPGSDFASQPSTAEFDSKKYRVFRLKTASLFRITSTKNQPPLSNECLCSSGINFFHTEVYNFVHLFGPGSKMLWGRI